MKRKENFAGSLPGTGRGLVAFPDTYVVVDLETTGLDPERDQIIEIGALEVVQGKRGRTFSTLIQTRTALEDYGLPEAAYFLETFLPSFSLTLDELK